MKTRISLALLALVSVVGCTSDFDAAESEDIDDVALAAQGCGAKYNEAFAYYKRAVEASKDRLRNGVCQSANGFQWSIANDASYAVMTCSDFRQVIRTSPWAAPLRQALAPSLTLRSITGELQVIKNTSWQNWTGTEKFFTAGLSFWARAEGAYGSSVRIDFKANGVATWGEHTYNPQTGDIGWRTIPATYKITKTSSSASAPRVVTVTREGKVSTFALKVQDAEGWKEAPLFVLEPKGTSPALGDGSAVPKLFSLVSECDA